MADWKLVGIGIVIILLSTFLWNNYSQSAAHNLNIENYLQYNNNQASYSNLYFIALFIGGCIVLTGISKKK